MVRTQAAEIIPGSKKTFREETGSSYRRAGDVWVFQAIYFRLRRGGNSGISAFPQRHKAPGRHLLGPFFEGSTKKLWLGDPRSGERGHRQIGHAVRLRRWSERRCSARIFTPGGETVAVSHGIFFYLSPADELFPYRTDDDATIWRTREISPGVPQVAGRKKISQEALCDPVRRIVVAPPGRLLAATRPFSFFFFPRSHIFSRSRSHDPEKKPCHAHLMGRVGQRFSSRPNRRRRLRGDHAQQ